jgi:hypothetical protein
LLALARRGRPSAETQAGSADPRRALVLLEECRAGGLFAVILSGHSALLPRNMVDRNYP